MIKKPADEITLNQAYDDLVQGVIGRTCFEETVFRHLWQHGALFGIREKDKEGSSDFLSWIYPRLSGAMARFNPGRGVPFEAFLHTIIRLAYREYKSTAKRHKAIETIYWKERAAGNRYYQEEEPQDEPDPIAADGAAPQLTSRQVLILALKSYYLLTDSHIEKLLPHIDYDRKTFENMLDKLRELREKQDVTRRNLKERCHSQHCRSLLLQKKLAMNDNNIGTASILRRKLQHNRLRLGRMIVRLKAMRISATNRQLSQVAGIPKGTIDSTLFQLRKKCSRPAAR